MKNALVYPLPHLSGHPDRARSHLRRFTSAAHVQRFLSVHGVVLKLFPLGRHLGGPAAGQQDIDSYQVPSVALSAFTPQQGNYKQESIDITLAAGEGMEYKYHLEPGGTLLYSWTSTGRFTTSCTASPMVPRVASPRAMTSRTIGATRTAVSPHSSPASMGGIGRIAPRMR